MNALHLNISLIAAFLMLGSALFSQGGCEIDSYDVVIMELKKPKRALDANNQMQVYNECYIVKLKGKFPPYDAEMMNLTIGDENIREFSATESLLYFKIYDPAILQRLTGKRFRYRFRSRDRVDFGMVFRPNMRKPLPRIKSTQLAAYLAE